MKRLYSFFGSLVALCLWGSLLLAQQAYKPARHWQGLNLRQFFGTQNTATGTGALGSCTSCYQNVADGNTTLNQCTTCWGNVGVGFEALDELTTGSQNTAVGWAALDVTTGSGNTAVGNNAGANNSSGSNNTALGSYALGTSTASGVTAIGSGTLANPGVETNSTAVGYDAGYYSVSTTGRNTVIGANALFGAGGSMGGTPSTGSYNFAGGNSAMYFNTTGSGNVAVGFETIYLNSSGSNNTAVGDQALLQNTTGSNNTIVGSAADVTTGALTNAMALGANAAVSSSNTVVVGSSTVTSIGGYANWTNFSDGRYKKNIQSNVPGLAFINQLNPVTYTLDVAGIEGRLHPGKTALMPDGMQEKSAVIYTGFVAQDVEKAAEAVHFTFSGIDKPLNPEQSFYGLRYSDFVPPLVKAVQEMSASIDSLKTQLNELRAQLLTQKAAVSGASLEQNAPNPFSGSTVIPYSLPGGAARAQMQISDINGNVLAVIPLSGNGRNSITADVSGYSAGTYVYTLIVDGKLVGSKQMISVK